MNSAEADISKSCHGLHDLGSVGKSVKSYIIQNGGTTKPWALCKLNSGNFQGLWLGGQIC